MSTTLSEVVDLFMMKVTDYRLLDLFDTSEEDFENYVQAFLIMAITEFSPTSNQALTFDTATKTFSVALTDENKVILASLMMKNWMQKNVNDITQMNLHITDRDFRVMSEAQNLREKVVALNSMKEECSQLLLDYGYRDADLWENWANQTFVEG